MTVQAFGYIGVRADSLEDWSTYAGGLLGLQRVDKGSKTAAFRMDDRKQRIVVDGNGGKGVSFFGWEVADAAALDATAARLEAAGVKVARGARALADERHVKDLIVTADPFGNRVEIFHGAETASDPFKPGRNISGFRTGPLGLGHAVLNVESDEDIKQLLPFYRDLLGFRLTDFYNKPFGAYFMHVNPRHHSLAFIRTGKKAVHHIMMELYSFDDMGQGYDIAQMEEGRIATTMGRHTSDFITSFYTWTPSEFMVEYGWGARDIDPATWQSFERNEGPSLWGHERGWLPEKDRIAAREKRMQLARDGVRQPVQVIEGNFEVNGGFCPWLDAMTKGQKRA
ncbi:MAG TPA: VOC family protein [Xanthobacteraceae bacterium]|nr:VOC family protein [Xanthobacteraceae bacterium]